MDLGALARPTSSPALLLELSELPTPTKSEALNDEGRVHRNCRYKRVTRDPMPVQWVRVLICLSLSRQFWYSPDFISVNAPLASDCACCFLA